MTSYATSTSALFPSLARPAERALSIGGLARQLETWAAARLRANPRLRVQAQDLAQEALARLLASYGRETLLTHPPRVTRSLARRTLDNLIIDEARRKRALVDDDALADVADRAPAPDEALAHKRGLARLERSLSALEAPERAFLLAVMRLDSVPAAQREAGWPSASPYYHLARLLRILRDTIDARD